MQTQNLPKIYVIVINAGKNKNTKLNFTCPAIIDTNTVDTFIKEVDNKVKNTLKITEEYTPYAYDSKMKENIFIDGTGLADLLEKEEYPTVKIELNTSPIANFQPPNANFQPPNANFQPPNMQLFYTTNVQLPSEDVFDMNVDLGNEPPWEGDDMNITSSADIEPIIIEPPHEPIVNGPPLVQLKMPNDVKVFLKENGNDCSMLVHIKSQEKQEDTINSSIVIQLQFEKKLNKIKKWCSLEFRSDPGNIFLISVPVFFVIHSGLIAANVVGHRLISRLFVNNDVKHKMVDTVKLVDMISQRCKENLGSNLLEVEKKHFLAIAKKPKIEEKLALLLWRYYYAAEKILLKPTQPDLMPLFLSEKKARGLHFCSAEDATTLLITSNPKFIGLALARFSNSDFGEISIDYITETWNIQHRRYSDKPNEPSKTSLFIQIMQEPKFTHFIHKLDINNTTTSYVENKYQISENVKLPIINSKIVYEKTVNGKSKW